LVFGVWLVDSQFPFVRFSPLWWHTTSVFVLIAGLVAAVGWVLLVTLYYMGYHIDERSDLAIRIDVTKRIDRLGLIRIIVTVHRWIAETGGRSTGNDLQ
jgi:hypothetical protein